MKIAAAAPFPFAIFGESDTAPGILSIAMISPWESTTAMDTFDSEFVCFSDPGVDESTV